MASWMTAQPATNQLLEHSQHTHPFAATNGYGRHQRPRERGPSLREGRRRRSVCRLDGHQSLYHAVCLRRNDELAGSRRRYGDVLQLCVLIQATYVN
jgi:hypothetical protein